MDAVSLALRLYLVDRDRGSPPTLAAPAPEYLPAAPVDPLARVVRPLVYVTFDDGAGPMVYSVGDNGIDDTRDNHAAPPSLPCYGWRQGLDEWRDLSRWHPPTTVG